MSSKKFLLGLCLIGLVALAMRLVTGEITKPLQPHGGMTRTYFTYASNMLQHGVYSKDEKLVSDSLRMPLYPIFLAGIRVLCGGSGWERGVSYAQYVLSALSCVLLALLGFRTINRSVGILSGLIAAFYLEYYYLSIIYLRETLSIFLLLLFLCCFLEFVITEKPRWAIGAAGAFGVGILNRPESSLMGIILVLFYLPKIINLAKRKTVFFLIALLLASAPWAIWVARNGLVHKHFIPFSTDGAWGFFMGQVYHPDEAYTVADPVAMKMIAETPIEYDWYQRMNKEAFAAIRIHPLRNLHWAGIKIYQTFSEYAGAGMGLLYPLIWIGLPLAVFKNHKYRVAAGLGGLLIAILHLKIGKWESSDPLSLLHIRYSDIVIPGAAGFALLVIKNVDNRWKILAASFLTLIISVVLYIALLRARLVLADWILMIGTGYFLFELTNLLKKSMMTSHHDSKIIRLDIFE